MDFATPEASQFRWGSFCLVLLGVERLSWRRQGLVSDEKYRVPKKGMVKITRIAGRNKAQGEDQQGIEPRTHTHR